MLNQVTTAQGRRCLYLILSYSFLYAFELTQETAWIASHSSLWICHSKNTSVILAESENHFMFEDSLAYNEEFSGRMWVPGEEEGEGAGGDGMRGREECKEEREGGKEGKRYLLNTE